MAKAVLIEEYSTAILLIEEMLNEKTIGLMELENWPLFMWLRDTDEFKEFKENNYPKFKDENLLLEQGEEKDEITFL